MSYGGGAVGVDFVLPSPGSPPGMTTSKSSKSSSFHSISSDEDGSDLGDVGHFEDIGLDDDTSSADPTHTRDHNLKITSNPNPYSPSYVSDLRAASAKHVGPIVHPSVRELGKSRSQRDITSMNKTRPPLPSLQTQARNHITVRSSSLNRGQAPHTSPLPQRGFPVRSSSTLSVNRRRRSPSPNHISLNPRDPHLQQNRFPVRRSSWQSSVERRSVVDIEKECDDDDDNIPDDLILDNVPISPRPPIERIGSRPPSTSTSPDRAPKSPKERVRSIGNGTPAIAVAQGSLRSPSWKSDISTDSTKSRPISPLKGRAKSWTAALSDLNFEAKALTEKLEQHADDLQRRGSDSRVVEHAAPKPRVKSALAELPPLRRTNIMIDPLPVSKEKEAVLSRTRPSWLPPKDPAEEKKHLKEYQRMMAISLEAEKKREAAKRKKEQNKEAAANALLKVWEDDVLPRWNDAIRERRTRELWWKGVAPRSRGAVWSRAFGNELGLTETSFNAALSRAHDVQKRVVSGKASVEDETRMGWLKEIKKDVESATFIDLKIFQSGGPLNAGIIDVLSAYAMYRSDIGYVSGCNLIAAILLLNMPTPTAAFISLANILNRPLPLSFYAADPGAKFSAYNLLLQTLSTKSPRLHEHLTSSQLGLDPEEYLNSIYTALFADHLSLDECTRLWDVFAFEGDSVLVRAGVALLLDREMALLGANTVEEVKKALKNSVQLSVEGTEGREDKWMTRVREAGKA